jgi:hypothetical protein
LLRSSAIRQLYQIVEIQFQSTLRRLVKYRYFFRPGTRMFRAFGPARGGGNKSEHCACPFGALRNEITRNLAHPLWIFKSPLPCALKGHAKYLNFFHPGAIWSLRVADYLEPGGGGGGLAKSLYSRLLVRKSTKKLKNLGIL